MKVTSEELRALKPLVVAIVGPTNEGKTSLLRTLTHDSEFGHVNAYTGTTTRAEIQKVFYRGVAEILCLIDTPGFQTSSEILEMTLNLPEVVARREFGLADVMRAIPQLDQDYQHDLRAWREVERCDVVILVVNVEEDPGKSLLRNTLRLLKNTGKPVVVAYNNVRPDSPTEASEFIPGNFQEAWDAALSEHGFFLVQQYDAHRRSFSDEIELFEMLAALTRDRLTRRVLRLEIQERRVREQLRIERSREILAAMLLDAAAYGEVASNVNEGDVEGRRKQLEELMKEKVVRREHEAQRDILDVWDFKIGVLDREMLDVTETSGESDELLGKEAKRHVGVGSGAGVAVGAALGLALDAASAGITLGAGLAIGTFLGGLVGGGSGAAYNSKYDARLKRLVVRPHRRVTDALLARGIELVNKLQTRGKAMEDSSQAQIGSKLVQIEIPALSKALDEFSKRAELSAMNAPGVSFTGRSWRRIPGVSALTRAQATREGAIVQLSEALKKELPDAD